MTDTLSKGAAALVYEGRQALRPTDADKARIFAALRNQLATGGVDSGGGGSTPLSGATGAAGLGKFAALTAGVVVLVVAFVAISRLRVNERSAEEVSEPTSSVAGEVDEDTNELLAVPEVQVPKPVAAERAVPLARNVNRADDSDRLAEEVALLTRAERDFHAGNFARALAGAEEHRRKFPKGTLALERGKLRVEALCGMGRNDDAQSEAKRLGTFRSQLAKSERVCSGER